MGLWDVLTKPLLTGGETLRWQQPLLLGMRLRRETGNRMLLVAACLLAGASVLAISIRISGGTRVSIIPVLIGALFGSIVALYVAFRKEDWGGHVIVGRNDVQLRRTYPAFPLLFGVEHISWPYSAIDRCVLIPGSTLGTRYSVMMLTSENETHLLGVPRWVEIQNLGSRLKKRGVDVSLGKGIPDKLIKPRLAPSVAGLACSVAGLLAGVAFLIVPEWGDSPNEARTATDEMRRALADQFPGRAPRAEDFGDALTFEPPAGVANGEGAVIDPKDAAPGRDTPALGGAGGFPFRTVSETGAPMVGLRWYPGEWAGKQALARLEPIFDRTESGPAESVALAPDGYAVGAVEVDAGEFVFAVRMVAMRLRSDGRLDAGDTKRGEWLGFSTGRDGKVVSGDGARVIGLHGRGAAVLDAVGLVLQSP